MAGVLESLATGLKGAGGILSPTAFKAGVEEDAAQAAERRRMELMQFQEQLAGEKEKLLSDAVAPALSRGDFEGAAAAAAKSGAPGGAKLAMDLLGKAEERKARALQVSEALDQKRRQAEQDHELRLSRLLTDDARQAEVNRHNTVLEAFKAREIELNASMKQMGFDIQKERGERQAQQQLNTQVQKLGGALEKAGLPESDAVLGAVETALDKRPDIAEYISGPKSWMPDMSLPNDVTAGRQAFQKLFNITLKNRSGSAVTNQELDRLKQEFATGVFKTPVQLKTAVEQARNIINRHYASVASGYGKDVLGAYNENVRGFGGRVVLESDNKTEDPLGIR